MGDRFDLNCKLKFLGLKQGFRLRASKHLSGRLLATRPLRGRCFPLEPRGCPVRPQTGKINEQLSLDAGFHCRRLP